MEKKKRRKPTQQELSRLKNDDNGDVPSVTLKRAMKALKEGDVDEADRLWALQISQYKKK